jgi:metallo-beta-lactamase class B
MQPGGKPHPIDRVLRDGDEVKLGGTTMVARLTAGHTPGCTTWTLKAQEGGRSYDVVISCSIGVNPGYVLVGNPDYPRIADDYVRSFKVMRALPADVFLGAHGAFYGLTGKHAQLEKGGPNPFIDPDGFKRYVDRSEQAFLTMLEGQKKAATK